MLPTLRSYSTGARTVLTFISLLALGLGQFMNEGPSGFGGPAGFGGPDSAATESETRAELQAEFESIPRGRPFYLYYTLETAPGWYAYYLNNTLGFTIRPSLQLDTIAGVELGELEFPLPQEKDTFGVPSLVFQGQTYFRLPVTVTADYVGTELTFTGTASWQICKESCLPPEDRAVSLTLAVTDAAPAPNTSLPADLKTRFSSRSLTSGAATLGPDGISLELSQPVSAPRFLDLDGQTAFGIAPVVTTADGKSTLSLALDTGNTFRTQPIAPRERLRGYLVTAEGTAWVDVPLHTLPADIPALASGEPDADDDPFAPTAETTAAKDTTSLQLPSDAELAALYDPSLPILQGQPSFTIWLALGGAFLGGMFLNLMPCVFPVLSLKVLSFVEKAGEAAWKVRLHGIFFTLGVVLSMWVLAIALFALKASTGQSINWGQQMSYPGFVAAVIIILFLFGLNMAGIFEMGTRLTSAGNNASAKNEYVATILSGVLTTVIATPCSGPFLGAAMGYTLSQPLWIALILFTVFALGISFPYLLLSFFPALTAKLPRPGAWMETLKKVLSFGMFAAAAFFMQTFAALTGGSGLAALMMALVVVGLAAYLYGHWSLPHLSKRVRYGLGGGLSLLILLCGLFMSWRATQHEAPVLSAQAREGHALHWHSWKPGIVEHLRAEGYYVWVDYTAVWCATCQVNKKVIFGNDDFTAGIDPDKLILVKADMTNHDPVITTDLARADRVAIPVNIIYAPDPARPPVLLEDLITVDDASEALTSVGYN